MANAPCVFLDIDTQWDFIDPNGALSVSGADQIVPNLARLVHHAAARGIPLISSADDHPPGDPEFADFPPHCLIGSPGQAKLPETLTERCVVVGHDRIDVDLEAIFPDYRQVIFTKVTFDVFSNPWALGLVEQLPMERYVVFGVATEYCVKAAANSLLDRGKQVEVVTDAIRAVDATAGQRALEDLARRGAKLIDTDSALQY